MYLKQSLLLLSTILSLLLGVAVLVRSPKKFFNILYFLSCFTVSFWALGICLFLRSSDLEDALLAAKVFYSSPVLAAPIYFLLAKSFPNEILKKKFAFVLVPGTVFVCWLWLFPGALFSKFVIAESGNTVRFNLISYLILSVVVTVPLIFSIIEFGRKSFTLEGAYAAQAKILSYGMLYGSALGIYFNLILPFFGNYNLVWVGPNAILLLLFFSVYGIFKNRLFQLRKSAANSTFLILLFLCTVSLFSYLQYELLTDTKVVRQNSLFTVLQNLVFLALFYLYAKYYIDKFLRKNKGRLSSAGYDLSGLIMDSQSLRIGITESLDFIKIKLNACNVVLLNKNNQYYTDFSFSDGDLNIILDGDYATDLNILQNSRYIDLARVGDETKTSLVMRLKLKNEEQWLLCIGEKSDGFEYSHTQIEQLHSMSQQLILGINFHRQLKVINEFNKDLKGKIEEATKKLKSSNTELKRLARVRNEILQITSHQLIPQLTASKGFLELINKSKDKQDDNSKLLDESLSRMIAITSRILRFDKIDHGSLVLNLSVVAVGGIIENETKHLALAARKSKCKIIFLKNIDYAIYADSGILSEAIYNLLDNAIKYSPPNSKIKVSYYVAQGKGVIKIQNPSIVIGEHDINKFGHKYFRSNGAKRVNPNGTGLGLHFVDKVTKLHGYDAEFKYKGGDFISILTMTIHDKG